jgi:hypothetical protein
MSSYFDRRTRLVSEASSKFGDDAGNFLKAVAEIEQEVIADVQALIADREFPVDLRVKAETIITNWHVGESSKANEYVLVLRMSELVEKMHDLFHQVASTRIMTRFGRLNDHPRDMLNRLQEEGS